MRLAYYAGVSTAAAAACLLKAFHERPNFYSATVYLSQSNACLLILTNLLLVLACSLMYGLQRILYGPLRPIEVEQLSEKAWYAVLDTLLAMPSFREDVGGWLLAMFTLLLAGKVWGWIGEGKVDVLEQQPPANPTLFHTRLSTSLMASVIFDLYMLDYCVETVLADPRPGMMVIFTFEFAILSISSTFTLMRYALGLIQIRVEQVQIQKAIDERKVEIRAERASARQNQTADGQPTPASSPNEEPIEVDVNEVDVPGWEDRRRYLFALEAATDFIKLLIYIVFVTVSITFNGLPMHIMRDVYMTFASFSKRVSDFVAYRKATSDMNTRYPDATTEEIRGDACIVCRENMVAWEQTQPQAQARPAAQQPVDAPAPARRRDEGLRAKKLPCGHILHLRCLKAWLERQQVCPTCRRPVIAPTASTTTAQQAADGANPAGAGRQGQQPARRQGRARILNFGPIRIGFLNGPGDQIANLIRQMNGQQPAPGQNGANQGATQGANQQHPNHLSLQVPDANRQQDNQVPNGQPQVSAQTQLMQLETRIMQDAYNLVLEQQQLATLRAMQAELARLRAFRQDGEQLSGTAAALQDLAMASHRRQANVAQPTLSVPRPPQPQPTIFRGNETQQLGNGHASLPEGMTLPPGWTLMPLHRTEAIAAPQIHAHVASGMPLQTNVTQPSAPAQMHTPMVNGVTPQHNDAQTHGPVNDDGSPLFVPTMPALNGTDVAQDAPPTSQPPQNYPTATESTTATRNPWNAEGGWGFVDRSYSRESNAAEGEQQSAETDAEAAPLNGAPAQTEHGSSSDESKRKGKAVEVEEVPDPDV